MADTLETLTPDTAPTPPTPEQLAQLPMRKEFVEGIFRSAYAKKLHLLNRVDAAGNPLPRLAEGTELTYGPYAYSEYVNAEQIKDKGDWPSDAKIVDMVNVDKRAAARQAAMKLVQDAHGLVQPDAGTDDGIRFKTYFNGFSKAINKKTGKVHTKEEATAKAHAAMELE